MAKATITLTIDELASLLKRAMESEEHAINNDPGDDPLEREAWRTARAEKIAERIFLGR